MREVQDQKAMGWRDLETRKFLRELVMKEQAREILSEAEPLIERVARSMRRKICSYLEVDRTGKVEELKQFEEGLSRRDWEGQDNMAQFICAP